MDLRFVLLECLAVNEFTSNEQVKNHTLAIYDIALKEIKKVNPESNANQNFENVKEIRKKLKLLLKQYQHCIEARKEFFSNFEAWKKIRLTNIGTLKIIAEAINLNRKNCNIAKISGNVVSAVGGGMCVASAILAPFFFGATIPLAIAGGAAVGAGGATSFGTSITEVALEAKNMKAAQSLLDEDKISMQGTMSWFKQSEELKALLESVMGFKMMEQILEQVHDFFEHFNTVQDAIKSNKFLSVIQSLIKLLSRNTSIFIQFVPLIIAVIFATIMIDKKHRFLVDTLFFLQRSVAFVTLLIDVLTDGAVLAVNGIKGVNAAVLKAAARGGLAAVGIAVDITSIVLTSIDIHNGSKSKNAESINECVKSLEQELEHFQGMYEELRRNRKVMK